MFIEALPLKYSFNVVIINVLLYDFFCPLGNC